MTALEKLREMYILFPAAIIGIGIAFFPLLCWVAFFSGPDNTKDTLKFLGKYVLLPIVVYALIGVVLFQDLDGSYARQKISEERMKVIRMQRQKIKAQKMYDAEAK